MNRQIIITLAKEAAKIYLNKNICITTSKDLPDWLLKKNFGVFIVFVDFAKNIRSQAGTIYSTKNSLAEEIIKQTIKCVKGNDIFKPIDKSEINGLKLEIYIILKQEPIFNLSFFNPGVDGILVKNSNNKYGLALPQKINVNDLVKIACRNGKIDYKNDNYKIFRLIIKKFIE